MKVFKRSSAAYFLIRFDFVASAIAIAFLFFYV